MPRRPQASEIYYITEVRPKEQVWHQQIRLTVRTQASACQEHTQQSLRKVGQLEVSWPLCPATVKRLTGSAHLQRVPGLFITNEKQSQSIEGQTNIPFFVLSRYSFGSGLGSLPTWAPWFFPHLPFPTSLPPKGNIEPSPVSTVLTSPILFDDFLTFNKL